MQGIYDFYRMNFFYILRSIFINLHLQSDLTRTNIQNKTRYSKSPVSVWHSWNECCQPSAVKIINSRMLLIDIWMEIIRMMLSRMNLNYFIDFMALGFFYFRLIACLKPVIWYLDRLVVNTFKFKLITCLPVLAS